MKNEENEIKEKKREKEKKKSREREEKKTQKSRVEEKINLFRKEKSTIIWISKVRIESQRSAFLTGGGYSITPFDLHNRVIH